MLNIPATHAVDQATKTVDCHIIRWLTAIANSVAEAVISRDSTGKLYVVPISSLTLKNQPTVKDEAL